MATIGSLGVNVFANTTALTRGLSSARKQVASLVSGLGGLGGLLATGLSIRGIQTIAEDMDKVAKASDRLGISTESLSAMGHAANLSGSSVEGLTRAMTLMQKNIGQAGGLGLDVDQLRAMNADQMFLTIADAINRMPDAASRTQAAMKMFGKSGAELLPLIMEGREGIQAMMADAERLGLTFDREAVARVEAANDAVTRLQGAFKGLAQEVAIAFAPIVEWVTNGIADAGSKIGDVIHALMLGFKAAQAVLSGTVAIMATNLGEFVNYVIRLANKLPGVDIGEQTLITAIGEDFGRKYERDVEEFRKSLVAKTPSEVREQRSNSIANGLGSPTDGIAAEPMRFGHAPITVDTFWSRPAKRDVSGGGVAPAGGFQGLEGGSAAAFSQFRRSQEQDKGVDVAKQQLTEAKKQTEALKKIDAAIINNSRQLEVVNIA